jgi:hypothetical protein
MSTLPNKLLILGDDHYIYFGGEEKVAPINTFYKYDVYELVEQYGVGPIDARDRTGKSILGGKFPLDKLRGQKKFCVAMVREYGMFDPKGMPCGEQKGF